MQNVKWTGTCGHLGLLLEHIFNGTFLDDVPLVDLLEDFESERLQELKHSLTLRLNEGLD